MKEVSGGVGEMMVTTRHAPVFIPHHWQRVCARACENAREPDNNDEKEAAKNTGF